MKKHAGFSLIELVVVIIVLGILAATALPRFMDITDQAKQSAIEAMTGGFATAVISTRAQWEAYGRPVDNGNNNIVDYDGTEFKLTKEDTTLNIRSGYPFALNSSSTPSAIGMTANDCLDLLQELMQNPPLATTSRDDLANSKDAYFATVSGTGADKQCRYYQLASASKNSSGDVDPLAGHSFTYKPAVGRVEVDLK
ncbi:MSHA pilin protein MshB [Photobacterium leiognathi lrivu.4.1]|uniref:MSHA pilin protein MshB n=1 Tax=Photobacterium leiognathi lrivu.4.1 TaxID=1248232 RepID=A0A0U1P8U3_PHOLE|nr:type II secretion system protein [Photobacterium leiognathi]GAD30933.1 MSHA pilin protein MshB [Photobacterium leiognathi lrivu.4.1]